MNLLHDTGYGYIELSAEPFGFMRGNITIPKTAVIYQLSVRTIDATRKTDIYGNLLPSSNIRCILSLNDALDRLIRVMPKGVLLLSTENGGAYFRKLDKKWLRFKNCAICKTSQMSENEWLNFIEEWYSNAI